MLAKAQRKQQPGKAAVRGADCWADRATSGKLEAGSPERGAVQSCLILCDVRSNRGDYSGGDYADIR